MSRVLVSIGAQTFVILKKKASFFNLTNYLLRIHLKWPFGIRQRALTACHLLFRQNAATTDSETAIAQALDQKVHSFMEMLLEFDSAVSLLFSLATPLMA